MGCALHSTPMDGYIYLLTDVFALSQYPNVDMAIGASLKLNYTDETMEICPLNAWYINASLFLKMFFLN